MQEHLGRHFRVRVTRASVTVIDKTDEKNPKNKEILWM